MSVPARVGGKAMQNVQPACFHACNVRPAYPGALRNGPQASFSGLPNAASRGQVDHSATVGSQTSRPAATSETGSKTAGFYGPASRLRPVVGLCCGGDD